MKISWGKVFAITMKYLPSLIQLAEGLFSYKKKTGAEKKAYVSDSLKRVVNGIAAESEGDQKETWNEVKDSVDILIEGGVALANSAGAFKDSTVDYTSVID